MSDKEEKSFQSNTVCAFSNGTKYVLSEKDAKWSLVNESDINNQNKSLKYIL